ncbi:MAG: hypothetical protein B7X00_01065 [Legionella sp. 21-45-4]|nr:MAG: hypothetical protein B7X00_01065 [Legionella sp. 21-45-4]
MKLLADSSLPFLNCFESSFDVTLFSDETSLKANLEHHDILVCRSTLNVNQALLENASIQCVATASSGVDHIDIDFLETQGIALFDAKGCNARAVTDYILSSIAYLMQSGHVIESPIGIMGVGMVGRLVARQLEALHFKTRCYDPPRMQREPGFVSCSLDELIACNVILIHANLHRHHEWPTEHFINADFLNRLAPHSILINAARGNIVEESALLNANPSLIYCTDVYACEPNINPLIIARATLCTPHIAGHSIEGKLNAVKMLYHKLCERYERPLDASIQLSPQHLLAFSEPWPNQVLKAYSPINETQKLKTSRDKKSAFLNLRKAHSKRHEF